MRMGGKGERGRRMCAEAPPRYKSRRRRWRVDLKTSTDLEAMCLCQGQLGCVSITVRLHTARFSLNLIYATEMSGWRDEDGM
jgi:hypothetical protein